MVILKLILPNTINAQDSINQMSIPCHCWVGKGEFKLLFSDPLFTAIGLVENWDRKKFDIVAPAYAGADYTHNNFAVISVNPINEKDSYEIRELKLFYPESGWLDVIIDGEYVERHDDDDW